MSFENKIYNVIYADPPWEYRNKKTGGSMKSGAESKYSTMSVDEICNLKIPAAKDSVLFLWCTVPMINEGLKVMSSWGFKYKTMILWRKIMSLGMGFWWRGQCEILLFGVRGGVKAFRMQEANVIQCKVGRHSAKPEEFRELIERAVNKAGLNQRLELFARKKTEGWHVWGNEVESDIQI